MKLRYRVIALIGSLLIRAWGATWRVKVVDEHLLQQARAASGPVVHVCWHGRLMPLTYYGRNSQVHVLASEHRDGELLGQAFRFLGFGHVRGSSRRGGARAIREMVSLLSHGFSLAVSIDGPTGPRFVAKPGPLEVAKLSGCLVVPVTTGSRHHWTLRTWDGTQLPWPFAEVRVRYGRAVAVPAGADDNVLEARRLEVERVLNEITEANDQSFAT